MIVTSRSLSARRAWIEIASYLRVALALAVALRKESVDRNIFVCYTIDNERRSLSARRAWIEINVGFPIAAFLLSRSPQGERG